MDLEKALQRITELENEMEVLTQSKETLEQTIVTTEKQVSDQKALNNYLKQQNDKLSQTQKSVPTETSFVENYLKGEYK